MPVDLRPPKCLDLTEKGLEALHQKYKDRGLQVLGFPCNQFGSQEPGSNAEIGKLSTLIFIFLSLKFATGSFCQVNYGVSFPIMDKVHVNGDQTHPLYDYLKSQAYVSLPGDFDSLFRPGVLGLTRIKWNFEKFLIDKDGTVYQRYSSLTKPESLEHDIEQLLAHEPRL